VVGIVFTVLHALIQAYVLTMLTAVYYGEVTEVHERPKKDKKKKKKNKNDDAEDDIREKSVA
jgi:F-type H+-transporting ATPase subunit a